MEKIKTKEAEEDQKKNTAKNIETTTEIVLKRPGKPSWRYLGTKMSSKTTSKPAPEAAEVSITDLKKKKTCCELRLRT